MVRNSLGCCARAWISFPCDDKKCILSQAAQAAASLVRVYKISPLAGGRRDTFRFLRYGAMAKLCCVPLANIPCFFSLLAPVEKANTRDSTYVRPGCSFFTPAACSSRAVTNGWPLSERRCSIAHIWDSQGCGHKFYRRSFSVLAKSLCSHLRRPIASDTARTLFMLLYAPANRNPIGVIF
jgi:hypothetical protein